MLRSTYTVAALIALAAVFWLYSGVLGDRQHAPAPSLAELREQNRSALEDRTPTRVRVRLSQAQPHANEIKVRGRTESNRIVSARAEVDGRITELPLDKGDVVAAGDIICRLDPQDRRARLSEAREALNEARINFEGAQRLARRGLQSETAIAAARARLASAQALLESRRLELANTAIRAPFDGIIESRPVELGDYLQPGQLCATVIDQDPILVVGQVSERDVGHLRPGMPARARLMDGRWIEGKVAFLGQQASATTRTYRLEIEAPNADLGIRSGMTAELRVPVATHLAHRVSPSLLGLDDAGRIGLRIVDDDARVEFVYVDVVSDDEHGMWVSGLPRTARIITVGQELVVPGERVDVVYEDQPSLPLAAPGKAAAGDSTAAGASSVAGPEQPVAAALGAAS